MATTTKGTLKYRKVQRTPQTSENAQGGGSGSSTGGSGSTTGGNTGNGSDGDIQIAISILTAIATSLGVTSCM